MATFSDEERAFLCRPLHAVLATHSSRSDRGLSQSVVWFHLDDDTVWISCHRDSVKVRHVKADPRVSLLVLAPHGGAYLRIEGLATADEEVSPRQRLELVGPYRGAEADLWVSEHPVTTPQILVRITPEHIASRGLGSQHEI